MSSSSSSSSKICFNKDCKELKSEPPRPGWKLRGVGYAQLCDRCGSLFDEGRFCDTFHSNAAGWSCCESCGKRIHCGCIASAHAFALLDAGGIECVACAKKNTLLAPNTPWPPCFPQTSNPERLKDVSTRNWTQLVGSGPVPWRQAPTLFSSSIQSELHPRAPNEVELSTGFGVPSLEKRKIEDFSERLSNGGPRDIHENGNAGINQEEQTGSLLNKSQQPPVKDTPSSPYFGLAVPYESLIETNGQIGVPGTHLRATVQQPTASKQFHGNSHNGIESVAEAQNRNGRPRADARGRNQLLPRYWPRFTDQDLQKISGDSNSVVTPLFEKMLSASDAGRIGRLVLPKKCAEAYFPAISQPEGLPLKVQDSKGKEWIFQFRFWPNNNSRMYVLEGVTPCIQNMQLQAGDIVTFSRLEPEGKLVMGFRKASTASASDQDNGTNKSTTGVSMNGDVEMADPSVWAKVDKSGYIATEALGLKSSIPRKRKNTTLGSKSKRLKIENEDLIELKITWQEAQGQLRPPENHVPSVLVIEGYEFEEYEEAPTLGKPTIFATDTAGEKNQWVQCEDCSKWRKLPANALLPPKWTCLNNSWDPERSSCSAPQELRTEQLEDLLPLCNSAVSKKTKSAKLEPENIESMEGLDTLANLAILGESDTPPSLSSSQATTKHPRHRPGCSCIVCIQPPSGKGPKHKPSCTCNVCQTVKRRFHTLMMRREKKQSEKEAETSRKKLMLPMPPPPQQKTSVPEEDSKLAGDDSLPRNKVENNSPNQKKVVSDGSDDDASRMMKSSNSPFNIDLNIKPERDEEQLSPGSESSSMMRLLQDAERYLKQQRLCSSANNTNNLVASQPLLGGGTEEKINNITVNSSLQDKDNDHHGTLSINASASVSAT